MIPRAKGVVVLALVGGLVGTVVVLRRENAQLAAQIAGQAGREQQEVSPKRPAEHDAQERGRGTVARRAVGDTVQVRREEVARLQTQVGDLEAKARAEAEEKAANAAAIAANRDPERALAPLESFKNVGRGSPATAVQTLVWAALHGDEPTLLASIALADDAGEKARQLWARLPESARTKYPAPENLAGLMVTSEILRADAAQIVATAAVDARHALVSMQLAGVDGVEHVATELGADGWKITVPKKIMLALEKRLNP